jgi:hypothetical protein
MNHSSIIPDEQAESDEIMTREKGRRRPDILGLTSSPTCPLPIVLPRRGSARRKMR